MKAKIFFERSGSEREMKQNEEAKEFVQPCEPQPEHPRSSAVASSRFFTLGAVVNTEKGAVRVEGSEYISMRALK